MQFYWLAGGVATNMSVAPRQQILDHVLVAIWKFWRFAQLLPLNAYIKNVLNQKKASVFDTTIFFTDKMLAGLPDALQPVTVMQYAGEMVTVPIGCPHQIRAVQYSVRWIHSNSHVFLVENKSWCMGLSVRVHVIDVYICLWQCTSTGV